MQRRGLPTSPSPSSLLTSMVWSAVQNRQVREFHSRNPNSVHKYAYPHTKGRGSGRQDQQHRGAGGGSHNSRSGGQGNQHHQYEKFNTGSNSPASTSQRFPQSNKPTTPNSATVYHNSLEARSHERTFAAARQISTPSGFRPPTRSPPTNITQKQPLLPLDAFRQAVETSLTICVASATDGFIIGNSKRLQLPTTTIRQHQGSSSITEEEEDIVKYYGREGDKRVAEGEEAMLALSSSSQQRLRLQQLSDRVVGKILEVSKKRATGGGGSTPAALTRFIVHTLLNAASVGSGGEGGDGGGGASSASSSWEAATLYFNEAMCAIASVENRYRHQQRESSSSSSCELLLNHPDCPIRPLVSPSTKSAEALSTATSIPALIEEGAIPLAVLQEVVKPGVVTEVTAGMMPIVAADSWAVSLGLLSTLKEDHNAVHLLPVDTTILLLECLVLQPLLAQRIRRYQYLVDACNAERTAVLPNSSSTSSAVPGGVEDVNDLPLMTLAVPATTASTGGDGRNEAGGGPISPIELTRIKGIMGDLDGEFSMFDVPIPPTKNAKLCWTLLRAVRHQEHILTGSQLKKQGGNIIVGTMKKSKTMTNIDPVLEPRTAAIVSRIVSSSSKIAAFMSIDQTCTLFACAVNRTELQQHTHRKQQQGHSPSAINTNTMSGSSSSQKESNLVEAAIYSGAMASLLRCLVRQGSAIHNARRRHRRHSPPSTSRPPPHQQQQPPSSNMTTTSDHIMNAVLHYSNNNNGDVVPSSPASLFWTRVFHEGLLQATVLTILRKEMALDSVMRNGNLSIQTLSALECAELVVDLLATGVLINSKEGGGVSSSSKDHPTATDGGRSALDFLDNVRRVLLIRPEQNLLPIGSTTSPPASRLLSSLNPAQLAFDRYDTFLPLARRLERILARRLLSGDGGEVIAPSAWEQALLLCKDRRQLMLTSSSTTTNGTKRAAALEREMKLRGQSNRGKFELREDLRVVQTSVLVHALGKVVDGGSTGGGDVILQRLLADAEQRLKHYISAIQVGFHQQGGITVDDSFSATANGGGTAGTVSATLPVLSPDEALLTFLFGPQWLPPSSRKAVLAHATNIMRMTVMRGGTRQGGLGGGGEEEYLQTDEEHQQQTRLISIATKSLREATLRALSSGSTGGFLPILNILEDGNVASCIAQPPMVLSRLDDNFENEMHPLSVHYNIALAALQPPFVLQASPVRSFCGNALPLPYAPTTSPSSASQSLTYQIHREGELVWRLANHLLHAAPFTSLVRCLQVLSICSHSVLLNNHTDGGGAPVDAETIHQLEGAIRGHLSVVFATSSSSPSTAAATPPTTTATTPLLNRPRQLAKSIVDLLKNSSSASGSIPPVSATHQPLPWNCWRLATGVYAALSPSHSTPTQTK